MPRQKVGNYQVFVTIFTEDYRDSTMKRNAFIFLAVIICIIVLSTYASA
eukprot:gene10111-19007_t